MGAYSPAPIVDERIHQKIIDEVMKPTMDGLISEGSPYLGFLYAGLMIKDGELKVLEFNCRFGDPETQPILLRLQSSLVELCLAAINDGMDSQYNQLEKVWGAWHQNSIDNGEKTNWAVWKRTPKSDDGENAADYVVFNQFNSKEKMEDYINGSGDFSINGAISTMKSHEFSIFSLRKVLTFTCSQRNVTN